MSNSPIVYGVDLAKSVFQMHWVDPETGEVTNKQFKRAGFLAHFANRAPCLIGMEVGEAGPPGQIDAGGVREGVQYPQQE